MKLNRNFLTLLLFLCGLCIHAQLKTIRSSIYFDNAKSELTPQAKYSLDSIFKKTSDYYIQSVVITGNTDNVGNTAFNHKLSEERVAAGKKYFAGLGLPDTLFKTAALGESKPVTSNSSEEGKHLNRRVDIVISYIVEVDEATQSIWELFKQTERKPMEFVIDNSRDTAIRGEKGTVIYIKANTFKLPSKCRDKKVTFRLKEDFLKSEMLLDNLSTTSNGRLLETEGMIYTEAVDCNGKKLSVNRGKDMMVYQPTGNPDPNAKIFTGNRTAHDSIMNWTLNTNAALQNFTLEELSCCQEYLYNCRSGGCSKCKFFFCRILRFPQPFVGIFNKEARQANREFRSCQRNIRKAERAARKARRNNRKNNRNNPQTTLPAFTDTTNASVTYAQNPNIVIPSRCRDLQLLYDKYKVDNNEALIYALNKTLLDSFGVKTMTQLQDTINKLNIKKIELSYLNKTIDFNDYQYYVYNNSRLGWSNVDIYANINPDSLVKLKVNVKADKNVDCKLVFKNRRFVIPASKEDKKYIFDKIPANEAAWIVAIKYQNNTPYLFMQEILTARKSFDVKFEALSLEELKQKLKVMDQDQIKN